MDLGNMEDMKEFWKKNKWKSFEITSECVVICY